MVDPDDLCEGSGRHEAQNLRISLSTVKKYVRRVFAKLEVSDRTQAAIRAIELDLVSEQESQK